MIPRIIHQTWKTTDIPERFNRASKSWRRHHPDWTYILWTDAELDRLVRDDYPHLVELFRNYPDHIQRVDAARYMLLFKYGGIYADLDVACRRSFEDLREQEVFVPQTKPFGVSNDLMGCVKGSPFFGRVIEQLPHAHARWPRRLVPRYFRVLLTTGSLFLTGEVRKAKRAGAPIYVLPDRLYGGSLEETYVAHAPGGTWHQWQDRAFLFILAHAKVIASALAAAALAAWYWLG